jgi:hypothetical protein
MQLSTSLLALSIQPGEKPVNDSSETDSDISGAEQELALHINAINESYQAKPGVQDKSSDESEQNSFEADCDESESDITDSG